MKKIFLFVAAVMASVSLMAAPSCKLSGFPVTKKTTTPVIGALVTLAEVGNKSNKFQRVVNEDGFTMLIPFGEYDMTIEMEGYETYTLNIDIDEQTIDLGRMKLLTEKMAYDRDHEKAK